MKFNCFNMNRLVFYFKAYCLFLLVNVFLLSDVSAHPFLNVGNSLKSIASDSVNWKDSVDVYREQARQGEFTAYEKLARFYESGLGVGQDYVMAMFLYNQAGEFGGRRFKEYMNDSGLCLLFSGIEKAYKEKDSIAFNNQLSEITQRCPFLGLVTEIILIKDTTELIPFLESQVAEGNLDAKILLTIFHLKKGRIVPDMEHLDEMFSRIPVLYNILGAFYMKGSDYVEKDIDKAIYYFKKADDLALLSRKHINSLLECYRIKLKEDGEMPCSDAEYSRLMRLSSLSSTASMDR